MARKDARDIHVRGWHTDDLPAGTVIDHTEDGITAVKDARRGPFPWVTADGGEYSEEWAVRAIREGATVTKPEAG